MVILEITIRTFNNDGTSTIEQVRLILRTTYEQIEGNHVTRKCLMPETKTATGVRQQLQGTEFQPLNNKVVTQDSPIPVGNEGISRGAHQEEVKMKNISELEAVGDTAIAHKRMLR